MANRFIILLSLSFGSLFQFSYSDIILERKLDNALGSDLVDLPALEVTPEDLAPKIEYTQPNATIAKDVEIRLIKESLAPNLENLPKLTVNPEETKPLLNTIPQDKVTESRAANTYDEDPTTRSNTIARGCPIIR